jgi:hypothetical protein
MTTTDGYAREVTVRYARNFAAKTMKLRVPVKKDQEDWWGRVMRILERPYRLVSLPLVPAGLPTAYDDGGIQGSSIVSPNQGRLDILLTITNIQIRPRAPSQARRGDLAEA